jgi:hypothetical protein
MKPLKSIPAILLLAFIVGCATTSKVAYNTLASVQVATTGAYNGYLDLVVQGKLTTNSVPVVSKDYNLFQQIWTAAVYVAQFNTNSVVPQTVTDAAAKVVTDISAAKGGQ